MPQSSDKFDFFGIMTIKKAISIWPDKFQDTFPKNIETARFSYVMIKFIKLDFENEPRVQVKWQIKNQQSYISVSVDYPACPSSNQEYQPRHENSAPCKNVWQIYGDKKPAPKPEIHRMMTVIFLEAVLVKATMSKSNVQKNKATPTS